MSFPERALAFLWPWMLLTATVIIIAYCILYALCFVIQFIDDVFGKHSDMDIAERMLLDWKTREVLRLHREDIRKKMKEQR